MPNGTIRFPSLDNLDAFDAEGIRNGDVLSEGEKALLEQSGDPFWEMSLIKTLKPEEMKKVGSAFNFLHADYYGIQKRVWMQKSLEYYASERKMSVAEVKRDHQLDFIEYWESDKTNNPQRYRLWYALRKMGNWAMDPKTELLTPKVLLDNARFGQNEVAHRTELFLAEATEVTGREPGYFTQVCQDTAQYFDKFRDIYLQMRASRKELD